MNHYLKLSLISLLTLTGCDNSEPTATHRDENNTTTRGDGVVIQEKLYTVQDQDTLVKQVFEVSYNLAKSNPSAILACLHITIQGTDQYGKQKDVDMGTLLLHKEELDNLRKYQNLSYLINNPDPNMFEPGFINMMGYVVFNRKSPFCDVAHGQCGPGYLEQCPPDSSK